MFAALLLLFRFFLPQELKKYYIIKNKSKCHLPSPHSLLRAKNFHINQRKIKNIDHLFYIKCFGRLRFNPLKLIWIRVDHS
jgi:hypothetical protein